MIGNPKVLIVPGWMGSGPQHWQTYWEQRHPEYRRMALSDWRNVHRQDWVRAVEMAVLSAGDGVVLVAHSLGCLATIWWAASGFAVAGRIHAAMLVAPPDLCSAPGCLPALTSFTPVPPLRLPFPSLVVGSETDPFASVETASAMARGWGSAFLNIGRAGHINVDSGHGNWIEGERHLENFLCTLHLCGYRPSTSPASLPAGRFIV